MEPLTVILGASPQPERYAFLALQTLRDQGKPFALVNPRYTTIEGHPVVSHLSEVEGPVGTVTVYLAAERQAEVADELVALAPRRVIFNPGSENAGLKARLEASGVRCLEACTLVLLRTGQF